MVYTSAFHVDLSNQEFLCRGMYINIYFWNLLLTNNCSNTYQIKIRYNAPISITDEQFLIFNVGVANGIYYSFLIFFAKRKPCNKVSLYVSIQCTHVKYRAYQNDSKSRWRFPVRYKRVMGGTCIELVFVGVMYGEKWWLT